MGKQHGIKVYFATESARGRTRYRITVCEYVGGTRVRTSSTTSSESEARALYRRELARSEGIADLSVAELSDRYFAAFERRRSERTIVRLRQHAVAIFRDPEELVAHVDAALAAEWYGAAVASGLAAATHRDALAFATRLWQWGIDEELVRGANPWRRVSPEGEVRRGKPQLRLGEARAFAQAAFADTHPAATMALTSLLCGLRLGEISALVARDVEPEAGLLWVARGKTANARRTLPLPPVLARRYARLTAGLAPTDRLFSLDGCTVRRNVRRLCKLAGVPPVSPHGLRGTYTSLSLLPPEGGGASGSGSGGGSALSEIAARLGHGGSSGTRVAANHYADPATLALVGQRAVAGHLGLTE